MFFEEPVYADPDKSFIEKFVSKNDGARGFYDVKTKKTYFTPGFYSDHADVEDALKRVGIKTDTLQPFSVFKDMTVDDPGAGKALGLEVTTVAKNIPAPDKKPLYEATQTLFDAYAKLDKGETSIPQMEQTIKKLRRIVNDDAVFFGYVPEAEYIIGEKAPGYRADAGETVYEHNLVYALEHFRTTLHRASEAPELAIRLGARTPEDFQRLEQLFSDALANQNAAPGVVLGKIAPKVKDILDGKTTVEKLVGDQNLITGRATYDLESMKTRLKNNPDYAKYLGELPIKQTVAKNIPASKISTLTPEEFIQRTTGVKQSVQEMADYLDMEPEYVTALTKDLKDYGRVNSMTDPQVDNLYQRIVGRFKTAHEVYNDLNADMAEGEIPQERTALKAINKAYPEIVNAKTRTDKVLAIDKIMSLAHGHGGYVFAYGYAPGDQPRADAFIKDSLDWLRNQTTYEAKNIPTPKLENLEDVPYKSKDETITLYHGTTREAADAILKSGTIGRSADALPYFTDNPEYAKEYGPVVLKTTIPKHMLGKINYAKGAYGEDPTSFTDEDRALINYATEYVPKSMGKIKAEFEALPTTKTSAKNIPAPKTKSGYRVVTRPYLGGDEDLKDGGFVDLYKGDKKIAQADFQMRGAGGNRRAVLPTIEVFDEKMRGKGVGTELLDYIEQMAVERGGKSLRAQVVHAPDFFGQRGYVRDEPENTSMVKQLPTVKSAAKNIPAPKTMSEKAAYWLDDWVNVDAGMDRKLTKPDKIIVDELSAYRPDKPVRLYRGIRPGQRMGSSTGYESWTHSKDTAKGFAKGGEVISKVIDPNDILIDFTKIPKSISDEHGALDPVEREVIVRTIPAAKESVAKNIPAPKVHPYIQQSLQENPDTKLVPAAKAPKLRTADTPNPIRGTVTGWLLPDGQFMMTPAQHATSMPKEVDWSKFTKETGAVRINTSNSELDIEKFDQPLTKKQEDYIRNRVKAFDIRSIYVESASKMRTNPNALRSSLEAINWLRSH